MTFHSENPNRILCIILAVLMLGGCSETKEKLGLTRKSPDEFSVIRRAPLAMPPDYTLSPPSPGAQRPQEQSPKDQAREIIFGRSHDTNTGESPAENILLRKTGSAEAGADIREIVDREISALGKTEQPVAERLLGIGGSGGKPAATIVNAEAEAERLRKNEEEGKPVTAGETPTIED